MQLIATLIFFLSLAIALQPHVVHERRHITHPSWRKRSRVPTGHVLPMRIGLSQQNLHRGHELLMSISDPSSTNYSRHLTAKEVADMFAPARETAVAVKKWLVSAGIADERIRRTADGLWVGFEATVAEAEELFKTEYWAWEFKEGNGPGTVACDEYQVPQHLQEHIDYITPGIKLSVPISRSGRLRRDELGQLSGSRSAGFKSASASINSVDPLSSCDVVMTPQCIAALYKIPPGGKYISGNNLGIYERGDFVSNTSLDLFFANFTNIPQGTRPTRINIDGLSNFTSSESDSHGEADLDFQLAYPIVYPQNITQFQTDDLYYSGYGSNMYDGLFNTFLDALDGSYCSYTAFGETGDDPAWDPQYPNNHTIGDLPPTGDYMGPLQCGSYKPTHVISFSYGHAENTYPAAYEKRQCNEFLKLGLQGVSLIISSGDRGVSEDLGCLGPNATIFSPTYPGNCPYVTTVGATKVYPGKSIFDPESAVYDPNIDYASGGGFSNVYDRPKYQNDAVEKYFKFHNPPYPYYVGNSSMGLHGGLYNRIGRGIPDVSANGDNIATYVEGQFTLGAGTSASTPIFASIINRINGERLAVGKKPLGFLNPALYSNPSMLNDITNGTNPGCGTVGFSTAPGWDPVTGLGTPNYPKMLAYFMSLP